MPLVASPVSLVAAMRARVLDRGACGPLADRRAAAAARRELAGHLLDAALLLRIGVDVGQDHHGCCLLELRLGHHEPLLLISFVLYLSEPSSIDMLVLVGKVRMQAGLHTDDIRLHKDV